MANYRIKVQYDGTRYKGWQRQKSTDQTIQGKIEDILLRQYGKAIEIDGSGRTDAGVHAYGQVANFRISDERTGGMDPEEVCRHLSDMFQEYLPEDIVVTEVKVASERFHSRLNAVKKIYCYRIWNSQIGNVFERKYITQIPETLDVEAMKRAAALLLGKHDFAAFCGNAKMKKSTVREIHEIRIDKIGDEIRMTFVGSGFLQNMVRILSGTLVEVGMGKYPPEKVTDILASKERAQAGPTMPAKGLTLMEVIY